MTIFSPAMYYYYIMLHTLCFTPRPRSIDLILARNTSDKFSFFIAEHSTNAAALIFCFNFLPSIVVINFSDPVTRRSLLVPTNTIGVCGAWCRISGYHLE